MGPFLAAVLAGAVTGVLSGLGVGGGTLLLLYMTIFTALPQTAAQGVNLLYFLPTAATALPAHIKNGFVCREVLLPAISAGLAFSALGAWLATGLDLGLLRRLFGAGVLCVGLWELLGPKRA